MDVMDVKKSCRKSFKILTVFLFKAPTQVNQFKTFRTTWLSKFDILLRRSLCKRYVKCFCFKKLGRSSLMCTYLFFKKDYYFSNLVLAEVVLRKYLSDFRAKIRKTLSFIAITNWLNHLFKYLSIYFIYQFI